MRRWRTWSLRRRLMGAFTFALLLILTAGVVAFAWSLERILSQNASDAARTRSAQLAALIASGQYTTHTVATQLPSRGSVIQVVDSGGRMVASSEPLEHPLSSEHPAVGVTVTRRVSEVGSVDDPYMLAISGIRDESGGVATLIVATPLAVESRTVRQATVLLALGSGSLAVGLLFLANRMVTGTLTPVDRIREEVAAISRAGSGERVSVPNTGDEVAHLAQTMNRMLDRIARADAVSRQFTSDASHELRSPLATIRATLETADPALRDSADARLVLGEVQRLQYLVDDLLTLAKADDHGLRLVRAEVDLDDLVDQEVRRLRATTSLHVLADIAPARVLGDELRLGQVVRNLADNAVRHAHTTVRLGVSQDERGAVVTVDNDGGEIAPADRERVFARFTRLDDARGRDGGGSGLGLAIARTIVAAHRGTLVVGESPRPGECRFVLTLPADEAPGGS